MMISVRIPQAGNLRKLSVGQSRLFFCNFHAQQNLFHGVLSIISEQVIAILIHNVGNETHLIY